MTIQRWITETLHNRLGLQTSFAADKVLCEIDTDHQHLMLLHNKRFGKVLVLDGVTQITSHDAFVYAEMMAHVPLFAHGDASAEQVLIIGGGDCSIAGEVLKHPYVKNVTQVEIDESVVEFAKNYFPEFTKPVFADERFTSLIDDGMTYVATTKRRFDVIIVDSSDPEGPSEVLFSKKFYTACKRCLNEGGIIVTMNGVPFLQPAELSRTMKHFAKLFPHYGCYVAAVPTYVGGHLAMGWASASTDVQFSDTDRIAIQHDDAGKFDTRYWTPQVQEAAFALPRFIEEIVAKAEKTGV